MNNTISRSGCCGQGVVSMMLTNVIPITSSQEDEEVLGLLLEDGENILLEDGQPIILE